MQTGRIIARLRTEAGLTQNQLADSLFVSRDLVSKWETGKRLPDYKTILSIADFFSVDPDELIRKDAIILDELSSCFPDDYSADGEELKRALNRFLSSLNERDASVFVRRYYFLEDAAEIGEKYGIGENYVRTILMRARKKLKRFIRENSHE